MSDILKGYNQATDYSNNILSNFTNASETHQERYEQSLDALVKSEKVQKIDLSQLESEHGNEYFSIGKVNEFKEKIDSIIQKGEQEEISEEELQFVKKGIEEIRALKPVVVAYDDNGVERKRLVYVR